MIPFLPTTDFLSLPNAQMQQRLPGTVNFVKLHRELKYLGRIPRAFARLQKCIISLCVCVQKVGGEICEFRNMYVCLDKYHKKF